MKKLLIFLIIFIIPNIAFGNQNDLENIDINVGGKQMNALSLQKGLEQIVNKITKNDLEKNLKIYYKTKKSIEKYNNNNNENIKNIIKIIDFSIDKTNKELDIFYNKVNKIILGYTKGGAPIFAYYKGNPNNGFFGIFSNIHGGYEYGTYETANYLIKEFEKEDITGWFIIPTINPEGLEYYKNANQKYDAYLEGRTNINNVDLNRNFCTKNFELTSFIKNGLNILTGIGSCESEAETRVIVETLKKYKFNKIISLHSKGNILFIPDNSIDDKKVIDFGYEISNILPGYKYDIDFENDHVKKQKIKEYEINEGGSKEYTGTMETYIYEKYKIPTILIEIPEHGEIEYKLRDLKKLIKNEIRK
ncbi:MAG: M14 family zinc carboxypeptidase [Candidatus Gracilibacteria bacterium]|nr:M14 family zinc carboxypeptidase [Candidatus Gracilibacteria bacterium]